MSTFRSGLLLATLLLSAVPAAAFDIDLKVADGVEKVMHVDKPTQGRDFVEHVASYVRIEPKGKNRVFPVFINTHNYLTCPDSEKKTPVNDVKQVSFDRRSGVTVLGFFFDKPACDNPTFHMEPILGDS